MAIFQTVAELGSFRQAAKKLNLSPSVVSHHISKFEESLGVSLLYRSTRRMSLTDAGVILLAASQRMTSASVDGLSAIQRRRAHPTRTLTIAAATPFSHSPYIETFTRFAQSYPDVHLTIELKDRAIPLEGSDIDVAIRGRASDLDDSSYKARKLGKVHLCAFAAPSCVKGRLTPQSMDDLAE